MCALVRTGHAIQALFDATDSKKSFKTECFNILGEMFDDPFLSSMVFSSFVTMYIQKSKGDKVSGLKMIHETVSKVPTLLNAILLGVYQFNEPVSSVTALHIFINQEFPKLDWSHLKSPRVISIEGPLKRGVFDQFIFEMTFSHSSPQEIASSIFIKTQIDSVFSFLSGRALDNFSDALIISHLAEHTQILPSINETSAIWSHIFRIRQDYSSILACIRSEPGQEQQFAEKIERINETLPSDSRVGLFAAAILPNCSTFPQDILARIIRNSNFPSDNTGFPSKDVMESYEICSLLSLKSFYDICKNGAEEAFVMRHLPAIISQMDPAEAIDALFTAPKSIQNCILQLFLDDISGNESITADVIGNSIVANIATSFECICNFLSCAISQKVAIEKVTSEMILRTLFDNRSFGSDLSLGVILQASALDPIPESVVKFWIEDSFFAQLADIIRERGKKWSECKQFFSDFCQKCSQELVQNVFEFVRTLPDSREMINLCERRLGNWNDPYWKMQSI